MAKDMEILHFLTTEPFCEMLQTYGRLRPPVPRAGFRRSWKNMILCRPILSSTNTSKPTI